MTVSDLTERELVARIARQLPPAPEWLTVGIGDDAAVVEPARNRLEVLSADSLVEGVHFDRRFTPPDAIGHRALAINLSDLAAMGAEPRLGLLSLILPRALPSADFDALVAGLAALALRHRLHLVGGNLTTSPGPLIVDVTVLGTAKRRRVLTRGGARAGDEIYVSGTIGGAAAGLRMLKGGGAVPPSSDECVKRFLYPEARIRLGLLLARNRAASACIDLSDGLADGVSRIAEASGAGGAIDAGALPIEPGAWAFFEAAGADPVVESITRGDDYELLFTVRPRLGARLRAVARHADVPITKIGVCTRERALTLTRGGRSDEPLPDGYGHFR